MKVCTKCGQAKPLSEFYRDKKGQDGLRSQCRGCVSVANVQWTMKNIGRRRENRKKWDATHRENIWAYNRRWNTAHPEKMRESSQKSGMKRNRTPHGKLHTRISRAISRTLKGAKAGRSWGNMVSYTTEQLKRHLEKQFTMGMSWENYGPFWHVDHKIPVAAFNFNNSDDIDFQRCWSLGNLQPLKAKDNYVKGAKLDKPFQPSLQIGG